MRFMNEKSVWQKSTGPRNELKIDEYYALPEMGEQEMKVVGLYHLIK